MTGWNGMWDVRCMRVMKTKGKKLGGRQDWLAQVIMIMHVKRLEQWSEPDFYCKQEKGTLLLHNCMRYHSQNTRWLWHYLISFHSLTAEKSPTIIPLYFEPQSQAFRGDFVCCMSYWFHHMLVPYYRKIIIANRHTPCYYSLVTGKTGKLIHLAEGWSMWKMQSMGC